MKAALIACALFWLLVAGAMCAWIAHDVNQACGADMDCIIEQESPQ